MRRKLSLWWTTCSPRERTLLRVWTPVMLALVLWFAVVAPLSRRTEQLERRIPELEMRLNAMRSQSRVEPGAGSPSGIAGGAAAKGGTAADLRSALFRALGDRKISAELRALSSSRVEMRLPELAMKDALDLLTALRRETGARVVAFNASSEPASRATSRLLVEFESAP